MAKNHRGKGQNLEVLTPRLVFDVVNSDDTVGARLRELRKSHGFSMRALSEKSGLSANTLSLIENGKTSPSVSTLQQIAIALDEPLHVFFEKSETRPVVYTQHDQRSRKVFSDVTVEELGKGVEDKGLWPFVMSFNPKSGSGPEPLVFESSEFIYCLSGQVIYTINGTAYTLEPGDSLSFPARTPHTWENPLDEVSKVIIVSHGVGR